jgi:hypothetical protein
VVRCVLLLSAVACGGTGDAAGPSPEEVERPPYASGVTVGETYAYKLYTHCGVQWTRIDGTWWETRPIVKGEDGLPSGWGNPYDAGKMTIVTDRTAVYEGPDGDVPFRRTEEREPPFICM